MSIIISSKSYVKHLSVDRGKIINALNNEDFSDIEDCLQMECAKAFSVDYIVTRNIKDFEKSIIPAILLDVL